MFRLWVLALACLFAEPARDRPYVLLVFCGFVSSAAVSCNVFSAIFLCDEEGPAGIPLFPPKLRFDSANHRGRARGLGYFRVVDMED